MVITRSQAKVQAQIEAERGKPLPPLRAGTFFKFIGTNYGAFPYHYGLNTLAETGETFDRAPVCGPGGLFYTEAKHILDFWRYGPTLCRISVPVDAQMVRVGGQKWKSDQIVIEEKMSIEDVETWRLLEKEGAPVGRHDILLWQVWQGNLDVVKFLLPRSSLPTSVYTQLADNTKNQAIARLLCEYALAK
jgi:hypothetical protein